MPKRLALADRQPVVTPRPPGEAEPQPSVEPPAKMPRGPAEAEPEPSTVEPPSKMPRRSVEEVTASIQKAMALKSEAKIAKKPAAVASRVAAAAVAKNVPAKATPKAKPPTASVEWSRSQVLFRSGLTGPGQTHNFRFFDDASRVAALSQAKKMVREERIRRGL